MLDCCPKVKLVLEQCDTSCQQVTPIRPADPLHHFIRWHAPQVVDIKLFMDVNSSVKSGIALQQCPLHTPIHIQLCFLARAIAAAARYNTVPSHHTQNKFVLQSAAVAVIAPQFQEHCTATDSHRLPQCEQLVNALSELKERIARTNRKPKQVGSQLCTHAACVCDCACARQNPGYSTACHAHTALINGCQQNPPEQHHHAKQKQDFKRRLGQTARQTTYEATGCSASTHASSSSLQKQPRLHHEHHAPSQPYITHLHLPQPPQTKPTPTPVAALPCPGLLAHHLCSSLQRRRSKVLHQQLLQLRQQVVLMARHAGLDLSSQLRVLTNLPAQEDLHTLNRLAI